MTNHGQPSSLRWIPDQDDPNSVDDLFAQNVDMRMERMSDGYYWLMIRVDGEDHHFDLSVPDRSRTKVRAFARQPAPGSAADVDADTRRALGGES